MLSYRGVSIVLHVCNDLNRDKVKCPTLI
jgi:hypothetical protein